MGSVFRRLGVLAALAALAVAGCDGDGGAGGAGAVCEEPSQTLPLGGVCEVGAGAVPAAGRFEGRMAFAETDEDTFPLTIEVDTARGEVTGTLSFRDSRACFAGTLAGTIDAAGAVTGTWQASGADSGAAIEGTFEGRMGEGGGCGTWDNELGQDGPWRVGDLAPACLAIPDPAGLPVPVEITTAGAGLHWTDSTTCIPLTVSPALASFVAPLAAAASAWEAIECSPICFDGPTLREDAPVPGEGDRRIHLGPGQDPPANVLVTMANVTFRVADGEILNVSIDVFDAEKAARPLALVQGLGQALGFARLTGDTPSVMAVQRIGEEPAPDEPTAPLAADRESLCLAYPDPPRCP